MFPCPPETPGGASAMFCVLSSVLVRGSYSLYVLSHDMRSPGTNRFGTAKRANLVFVFSRLYVTNCKRPSENWQKETQILVAH